MKAQRYISSMLIALIFAAASIQAQPARRPATQENKEGARTTTTYKRESTSQKVKNTQPANKVQTQQVRKQQAGKKQPARTNNGQQARSQQARSQQAYKKEPARTNQGKQAQRQNATNTNGRQYVHSQKSNSNKGQLQGNRNGNKSSVQQVRNQPLNTSYGKQVRKPVSMTTSKNPRSTYRMPINKVSTEARYHAPVKRKNYYDNTAYFGGHHYHYAYPATKVKIHYHHNTYVNGYGVLYYPTYGEIYWTRNMYRNYHKWYPGFHWSYNYGHRIQTISVFDAKYNLGEVAYVFGRVYATWYNNETDDYLLFFGGDYPYQQFTVIVPGHVARKYSWRPERFFLGEHVTVNGLITTFDGSPEMVVKHRSQLSIY